MMFRQIIDTYKSEHSDIFPFELDSKDAGLLINADCMKVLPFIPDKSVQLILADLPYGITGNRWDTVLPLDVLWEQYIRILSDDGCTILTADGLFTGTLMMSNPKMFKYKLIWDKKSPSGFLNAKIMPLRRHEDILIFAKGKTTYNPIMKLKGRPRNKSSSAERRRRGVGDMCYAPVKNVYAYNNEYYPTSIIEINNSNYKGKIHPTEKPLELMRWLIRTYSNEGDMVLDNVMGSGNSCLGAKRLNRKYIGIEINPEYYKAAVNNVHRNITKGTLKNDKRNPYNKLSVS